MKDQLLIGRSTWNWQRPKFGRLFGTRRTTNVEEQVRPQNQQISYACSHSIRPAYKEIAHQHFLSPLHWIFAIIYVNLIMFCYRNLSSGDHSGSFLYKISTNHTIHPFIHSNKSCCCSRLVLLAEYCDGNHSSSTLLHIHHEHPIHPPIHSSSGLRCMVFASFVFLMLIGCYCCLVKV